MINVEKVSEETIYSVELRDFIITVRFFEDYNSDSGGAEIIDIQDLTGKDVELNEGLQDILLDEAVCAIHEFNEEG